MIRNLPTKRRRKKRRRKKRRRRRRRREWLFRCFVNRQSLPR